MNNFLFKLSGLNNQQHAKTQPHIKMWQGLIHPSLAEKMNSSCRDCGDNHDSAHSYGYNKYSTDDQTDQEQEQQNSLNFVLLEKITSMCNNNLYHRYSF